MKNISLNPMLESDIKFMHYIRNHELTRYQLENTNVFSMEETLEWFHNTKPNWFMICIDSNVVGYIRTSYDTGVSICVGCDIHPNFRSKGYAIEAYKQLLFQLLYEKNYQLIWLNLYNDNHIAKHLYEKLGFVEIGSAPRIVNKREYILMTLCKDMLKY